MAARIELTWTYEKPSGMYNEMRITQAGLAIKPNHFILNC